MVALKTERSVFLWHVAPHPIPKEAPADVTFAEILAHLQKAFDDKKAFAHIDSDGNLVKLGSATPAKNCIYIADLKTSKNGTVVALLINRGDPDVAHPSFINPLRSTVTNVPPGADEVQGWSSHILISLNKDSQGRHRACVERMPNVSSTLILKYLDALIDHATETDPQYVYQKVLRNGKKTYTEDRRYKLRLGINKVPSENLEQDIKDGILTGVTLIRTKPQYAGPASEGLFQELTTRSGSSHSRPIARPPNARAIRTSTAPSHRRPATSQGDWTSPTAIHPVPTTNAAPSAPPIPVVIGARVSAANAKTRNRAASVSWAVTITSANAPSELVGSMGARRGARATSSSPARARASATRNSRALPAIRPATCAPPQAARPAARAPLAIAISSKAGRMPWRSESCATSI